MVGFKESSQIESHIARCRLVLSLVAIAAVFADPTAPFVATRMPVVSGPFTIDPLVLAVMGAHLLYSVGTYLIVVREWFALSRLEPWIVGADVVLGAAIALMTEGPTSPFYAFFAFAVVASGFRSGMRQALVVTASSVALYLGMILFSHGNDTNFYIMRPVYLAIVGYLVGYLGQQRIELQQQVQRLEAAEQRHRIARDLHDGFAQALAAINLKIEGCRRALSQNEPADALDGLTHLQASVNREYDELRAYMSTLAGVPASPAKRVPVTSTRFSLSVQVEGSIDLADHVLQIAREGLSNVRRHASAESAQIQVCTQDAHVRISIEDDGVGPQEASAPWSIVSRVRELGGQIHLTDDLLSGFRLQILLPHS